jgi:hypothetical protein
MDELVEMLCVEELDEEGGCLSAEQRAAIPLSERSSKLAPLQVRVEP